MRDRGGADSDPLLQAVPPASLLPISSILLRAPSPHTASQSMPFHNCIRKMSLLLVGDQYSNGWAKSMCRMGEDPGAGRR